MKIVFISDTHGGHDYLNLPKADVLIHAGDFTGRGTEEEVRAFATWIKETPYKYKIVIAGNHDVSFEREPKNALQWLGDSCIYLNNSGVTVGGISIWGSPNQPLFSNGVWAFERNEKERKEIWETIPEETDILISHGPPKGIFDTTSTGQRVGCENLLERVQKIKPKIHVFGHIHEGGGSMEMIGGTLFINAAVVNENYQMVNLPILIEI